MTGTTTTTTNNSRLISTTIITTTTRPPVPVLNVAVIISLKYLSNIWRSLAFPLMNCETEPDLFWTRYCEFSEHNYIITRTNFMITSTKLYVLVVILPINDNIKFLKIIKQRFLKQFPRTNIDLK